MTTELRFCLSHRSTVWKVSWAGTPNSLAASRNALIFSIHLNAIWLWLTFFTIPGLIQFTNLGRKIKMKLLLLVIKMNKNNNSNHLHKTWPSFNTSKKLSISPAQLNSSFVIALTHSKLSWANSSLYLALICKRKSLD